MDSTKNPFHGPRRYIDNAASNFAVFKKAAELYPHQLTTNESSGLRTKPFDRNRGHPTFFASMYAVLNMIQVMDLGPGATIVEVGSGAGWLTEILLGLGYLVNAIEPSTAMVDEARRRVRLFEEKTTLPVADSVRFVVSTLEEMDLAELRGGAHAILFHEAFHHVIDERKSLSNAFELLREDGCLGISGDSRWIPGKTAQGAAWDFWDKEMSRFGTLESPFTREYLSYLLADAGFEEIQFHHGVNCFVPMENEHLPVWKVATAPADCLNTVTARRPLRCSRTVDMPSESSAAIAVKDVTILGPTALLLTALLTNTGNTAWPNRRVAGSGWVRVALCKRDGNTGAPSREAGNRVALTSVVLPGETIALHCVFETTGLVPPYELRMVAEDCFWFKQRTEVAV